jgi:hypothetical protein
MVAPSSQQLENVKADMSDLPICTADSSQRVKLEAESKGPTPEVTQHAI